MSAHGSHEAPPVPEPLAVPVLDSHTHLDIVGGDPAAQVVPAHAVTTTGERPLPPFGWAIPLGCPERLEQVRGGSEIGLLERNRGLVEGVDVLLQHPDEPLDRGAGSLDDPVVGAADRRHGGRV